MKNRFSISNAGKLRKAPSIYDKKKKKTVKKVTPTVYPPLQEDKAKSSTYSTPASSKSSVSNASRPQSETKRSQQSSASKDQTKSKYSINTDQENIKQTPQKARSNWSDQENSQTPKSENLRTIPRQDLPQKEDLISEYEQLAKDYETELEKRKELQSQNSEIQKQINEAYKRQAALEKQCLVQDE